MNIIFETVPTVLAYNCISRSMPAASYVRFYLQLTKPVLPQALRHIRSFPIVDCDKHHVACTANVWTGSISSYIDFQFSKNLLGILPGNSFTPPMKNETFSLPLSLPPLPLSHLVWNLYAVSLKDFFCLVQEMKKYFWLNLFNCLFFCKILALHAIFCLENIYDISVYSGGLETKIQKSVFFYMRFQMAGWSHDQ